jgi:hypothetical protein
MAHQSFRQSRFVQPTISRAIILKSHETGETSEVLHVITEEHGHLSLYAKGLRSPKGKLRGVLQPLALVEVSYALAEGADIATLRGASPIRHPGGLTSDFERLTLGLILAEVAGVHAEPGAPAGAIFAALLAALEGLEPETTHRPLGATALGLGLILLAAGRLPAPTEVLRKPWPAGEQKPRCFWLDLEEGVIGLGERQPVREPEWPWHPARDARYFPLPPKAVRFLYELGEDRAPSEMPRPCSVQLVEGLLRFVEWHHGGALKAAGFWRQTLAG